VAFFFAAVVDDLDLELVDLELVDLELVDLLVLRVDFAVDALAANKFSASVRVISSTV
jgi:hypothetical protein